MSPKINFHLKTKQNSLQKLAFTCTFTFSITHNRLLLQTATEMSLETNFHLKIKQLKGLKRTLLDHFHHTASNNVKCSTHLEVWLV